MRLGGILRLGDVIGLSGDLGAGKTTLVQGMTVGWGSSDDASSPTFVLVNVYRRPDHCQLFHLDAYRLSGAAEAMDLDIENMLEHGPLVVEWAERIKAALPQKGLWIQLKWIDEFHRDMLLSAVGDRYLALLASLRQEIFKS